MIDQAAKACAVRAPERERERERGRGRERERGKARGGEGGAEIKRGREDRKSVV